MTRRLCVASLALLVLSACQTSSGREGRWVQEEVTLHPTRIATSLRHASHRPCGGTIFDAIFGGLDARGTGGMELPVSKGGVLVGVAHELGDLCGSPAEVERLTRWFRGAVLFDVGQIAARRGGGPLIQVQQAMLYHARRQHWTDGDVELRKGACADQLMIADAPLPPSAKASSGAEFFPENVVPAGTRLTAVGWGATNVSLAVHSWVNGGAPNRGLVLAAEDETVQPLVEAVCVTHFGDFRLHVRYRYWQENIFPTDKM